MPKIPTINNVPVKNFPIEIDTSLESNSIVFNFDSFEINHNYDLCATIGFDVDTKNGQILLETFLQSNSSKKVPLFKYNFSEKEHSESIYFCLGDYVPIGLLEQSFQLELEIKASKLSKISFESIDLEQVVYVESIIEQSKRENLHFMNWFLLSETWKKENKIIKSM